MKLRILGRIIVSSALLVLATGQSAGYLSAYAQTPPGSSLSQEALDNATYKPIHTETLGDAVQLVDGEFVGTLYSYTGVHQGSYVFGDLNGDGVDDAVATVVETLGGSAWDLVLAAYVNDSGTPVFAGSVGFGLGSEIDSVSVDSGVITVAGHKVGNGDALCCPTQSFEDQLIVQGAQLVAASPTGSLRDLSSLKSFPGQVLMPPPGLQPFVPLQLSLVQPSLQSGSVGLTGEPLFGVYPQSYAVFFSNANEASQRQFGVAGARIAGAMSTQMYDDTTADSVKRFTGCAPAATYCAQRDLPRCTGIPCTLQAEIFRGLTVKGSKALVQHWQEDHAWAWDITWYDSKSGATYSLSTDNGADPVDFDKGLSALNQAGAQQLAAVAEKLVPWTGT